MPRQLWEYKSIKVGSSDKEWDSEENDKLMTELGSDGWELDQVVPLARKGSERGSGSMLLFFKREAG